MEESRVLMARPARYVVKFIELLWSWECRELIISIQTSYPLLVHICWCVAVIIWKVTYKPNPIMPILIPPIVVAFISHYRRPYYKHFNMLHYLELTKILALTWNYEFLNRTNLIHIPGFYIYNHNSLETSSLYVMN